MIRTEVYNPKDEGRHIFPDQEDTRYSRFAFYDAKSLLKEGLIPDSSPALFHKDIITRTLENLIRGHQERDEKITRVINFDRTVIDKHTDKSIRTIELYKLKKDSDIALPIAHLCHKETALREFSTSCECGGIVAVGAIAVTALLVTYSPNCGIL